MRKSRRSAKHIFAGAAKQHRTRVPAGTMTSRIFSRQARSGARFFLAALLVVSLGGCTNIKDDRTRTKTEGTMGGAVGGALLGAGIAAILHGGDPQSVIVGAATGAAGGGLAGAAYGHAVAKKKETYAKKESALDAELAGLKKQIAAHHQYNIRLKGLISFKEQQLASLLAADRNAGLTAAEWEWRTSVASKIVELDHQARSWQDTINAHKAVLRRVGGENGADELESGIKELNEERAQLLRQRERLSAISGKLAQ